MPDIRAMTIEDYDQAMDLWQRTPDLGVSRQFDCPERIAAYLRRNPGISTVTCEDGKIIGTVLAGHDGRRGSIFHVAVDPAFRGQKLAERMLERAIGCLKAEGITSGMLFTYTTSESARSFWSHMGWETAPNVLYHYKSF